MCVCVCVPTALLTRLPPLLSLPTRSPALPSTQGAVIVQTPGPSDLVTLRRDTPATASSQGQARHGPQRRRGAGVRKSPEAAAHVPAADPGRSSSL